MMPWAEVLAKLESARSTAKAIWVLADCCRAAPGLRSEVGSATPDDITRGVDKRGNLIVCTASSGDNPSFEVEELEHGIFTAAWLEALSGRSPEIFYEKTAQGKILTFSGLQHVLDATVKLMARTAGVRQIPDFPQIVGVFSPSMPVFMPAVER